MNSEEQNVKSPVQKCLEEAAEVRTALSAAASSTFSHTRETKMFKEAGIEKVSEIIKISLRDLQQNNGNLRVENRAETEKTLMEQLVKQTDFSQKYRDVEKLAMKDLSLHVEYLRTRLNNFEESFDDIQITEQFTPISTADVIFYYLMKDESSELQETELNTKKSQFYHSDTWYELCSYLFWDKLFHTQFYKRLHNNSAALAYLINKHPRLLLNQFSFGVLHALCEHLPSEQVHGMMAVRDENQRTCLFYYSIFGLPLELTQHYQIHTDELYELLLIQDVNKQTVLHVTAYRITDMLIYTYTPPHRKKLHELITIRDKDNKTALQTAGGSAREYLSWFYEQVTNHRYVLHGSPTVLIIYNTNNREGAEEEAETIYNAFKSTKLFDTKLEKDQDEAGILKLIGECANDDQLGIPQSALIVVLLSHGSVGVIEDCQGKSVVFSSIESAMCRKKLQSRPKILITQCCQVKSDGESQLCQSKQFDGKPSGGRVPYVPENRDFCAIMSSVPGETSERGVFIPKLAKHIKNCDRNENIVMLVERVCGEMSAEKMSQTPITQSTLTASFCPMNRDPLWENILLERSLKFI